MVRFFKHFNTILKHKYWVYKYCSRAGIPLQGILHDLSKLSPAEFIESAKYYQGNRSPIDACKEANGYSKAWLHHKGRNMHHYEYWQDNFDKGGEAILMPYNYAVEMLCDFMGAGRAYMGKNFSTEAEKKWWENKKPSVKAMHPALKIFLDECFKDIDLCFSKSVKNNKIVLYSNYLYAKNCYLEEKDEEIYEKQIARKMGGFK